MNLKINNNIYLFLLLLFVSCTTKNKTQPKTTLSDEISLEYAPPVVTAISQLPDTLQPKAVQLKNAPKTTKVGVPITHQLPLSISLADSTKTIIHPEAQGVGLFTTYTSDDGLAMDDISWGQGSVFVDSKGNIWFASSGGGVSKYDGVSFTIYSTEQGLINNAVSSIIEDKNGNLWFGTDGGVSKYDGESFISYTTDQGLAHNSVISILEDDNGNVWFGTHNGLSKYSGLSPSENKIKFISYTTNEGLANNTVRSIFEDINGNLWFGTDGGLSRCNASSISNNKIKFINYTTEQGLVNNRVFSIIEDNRSNLWFGTAYGVSKYDGNSFTNYTTKNGLSDNTVFCIFKDKNDNLWFGTYKGGVSKYDGKCFINYTVEQGLVNNYVRNIVQDKSGNLWFGTVAGVSKYEGSSFITYKTVQGLSNNNVNSIFQDNNGNFWFETYKGLCKYDGRSFSTYTTNQGLSQNYVRSIIEDNDNNLWLGTFSNGFSKFDGQSFITYTVEQGLSNNYVRSLAQDDEGNLWIGTDGGGVSKFDGKSFINYSIDQGLADNTVFSIMPDNKGDIWFGTFGGLSKFDGKSFTTYTTAQGLSNNIVFSIVKDKKGNLWVGTDLGLNVIKINENNLSDSINIKIVTKQLQNLPDLVIGAIQIDSKGRMVLGTNSGLYVLSDKEVKTILKSNSTINGTVYNQFTGYPVKDVNYGTNNNGAICVDNNNILWVGHGNNGVTRVNLDAIYKNKNPPNVVINKVRINNENICYYSLNKNKSKTINSTDTTGLISLNKDSLTLSQQEIITYGKTLTPQERDTLQQRFKGITFDGITKWYSLPENLVLPYQHNALTFEFNAIETGRNFLVNYQYKLVGSDKDWQPITKKKEATYTNLSEGKYTFLLKAQSPDGVWSEPIKFEFTVLPPWYRTWWAYLSYLIIGLFVVWLIIKIQTKKLKQRQKQLEAEVELATKEIREQKEQVEEAHKEITDSINYAERIQRSFLATNEILNKNLGVSSSADNESVARTEPNYFVFFQPKDVVSGDFYWADELSNGTFAMVNADSTGHGVPGAIMSILNISSIEKAIDKGLTKPADIFNDTRKTIIERLKKDGSKEGGKDGMDASIICYDFNTLKMTYCAAQNPIWIIRDGEVIQIKPEKMPVGKHDKDHIPFVGGEFQLQKGDQIYTITDGFQDQFGGPKGKKFMVKRLRQFVLDNSHLPMAEQHQKLKETFENWKQNLEQVDDVCVIGVKI
jgi:ligand-binding sensor domain-containing protein/serine phosphatase RsbU (regulator of sigma subunit)